MNKLLGRFIVAIAFLPGTLITSSIALAQTNPTVESYFQGYSSDGAAIEKNYCGVNYEKKGWVIRDFGAGIRGEVGIAYQAQNPVTVALLFHFSDDEDEKFKILPEEIKLYTYPGNKLVKPSSIERKPFNQKLSYCGLRQGEWITLKFPVQPEQVEQVALIFPLGTVTEGDPIDVRPFRFERIVYSSDGIPSPSRPPISTPTVPPVSPRFGSFESATAMPSNVKGAWIIDAQATEELIAKIPRPLKADKLAQWFGMASGYLTFVTYEFEGNTAKATAFRGDKVLKFERLSDQDRETTYALINGTNSKAQTLSVSMLESGNIRIIPSGSPEMAYLRWKPGQLKTETPDDIRATIRTWVTSAQAIVKTLTVVAPAPTKKVSESQLALDDAVRNGILRKATTADIKAFYAAYVEKKYTSKNLAVPIKEDALSVTSVDISRAYVVLKEFTYPSGMNRENSVVFFIPKGVPEPDGEIGHSAFYDFATLTVGCTLERKGRFDC